MNLIEKLIERKQELNIYAKDKMAYKHVIITDFIELDKNETLIEIINSQTGELLYGPMIKVINTRNINNMSYL